MTCRPMRPIAEGTFALCARLEIYLGVLIVVSGRGFPLGQFAELWPYIVTLELGFGTQVGL